MEALFYIAFVVSFVVGAGLPAVFVAVFVGSGVVDMVILMEMLFCVISIFGKIGEKNTKLKEWATNTRFGCLCLMFMGSFIPSLTGAIFGCLALPLAIEITCYIVFGIISLIFISSHFTSHQD